MLKHDHIVSKDLYYWLDYVNMKENEFWETADTFRDPRVWFIKDNVWLKKDIDGKTREYGNVYLSKKQIELFKDKQGALK